MAGWMHGWTHGWMRFIFLFKGKTKNLLTLCETRPFSMRKLQKKSKYREKENRAQLFETLKTI